MSSRLKDILELEKRRKIYNFINKNPGLHLRILSRKLNIPKTTLEYHLRYLKNRDFLNIELEGKYKRYFVKNNVGSYDKKILIDLRDEIPRGIIFFSYIFPKVYTDEYNRGLKIPITTLSYHLKKLVKIGVLNSYIENGRRIYLLKDRKHIYDLIIRYENSLSEDKMISSIIYYIKEYMPNGKEYYTNKKRDKILDDISNFFPCPFRA